MIPARARFAALFVALLAVCFLYGALDLGAAWGYLDSLLMTATVLAGGFATVRAGMRPWTVVALLVPVVGVMWVEESVGGGPMFIAKHILVGAFEIFIVARVLRAVTEASVVDIDLVFGATSSYLLLGLIWSHAYIVEMAFDPAAFTGAGGPDPLAIFTFYSFATLTTLGLADIVPVHPMARALTVLESALGSLFLAVVVARVVSLEVTHRERRG